jgi:hypothetical protein
MAKIKIWCGGENRFVEVEGFLAPGTGDLFAVRPIGDEDDIRVDGFDDEGWAVTHLRSGLALFVASAKPDAVYIARQIYNAAPSAWALTDAKEVRKALPPSLPRWVVLVQRAVRAGLSPRVLKGYTDFARDEG